MLLSLVVVFYIYLPKRFARYGVAVMLLAVFVGLS